MSQKETGKPHDPFTDGSWNPLSKESQMTKNDVAVFIREAARPFLHEPTPSIESKGVGRVINTYPLRGSAWKKAEK